uniref:Adenine-specific methyltransferase n=1 Tax=Siphoviridae sp. ctTfn5 TaxID=2827878 RepID=A0A8S5THU8_9CAUD|nr:MAG TPA: adenine-specific methyltransferase [Siphoviridae sp. ctTfn5]
MYKELKMNEGAVTLCNCDCIAYMRTMKSESVDAIVTDPPYLYLNRKEHKLERDFDEDAFFTEAKRVLKKNGLILCFGRGESFYRWNKIMEDKGLKFKEEVIWAKRVASSPVNALGRKHESISIHAKGRGKVRRADIPYTEKMRYDEDGMRKAIQTIQRIGSALNNEESLKAMKDFVEDGLITYDKERKETHQTSIRNNSTKETDKAVTELKKVTKGAREDSVIMVDDEERNGRLHPTQKPIELMERLLSLVTDAGGVVFDPFMGSGSTGVACVRKGRQFIGCEIDSDYFEMACKRIETQDDEKVYALYRATNTKRGLMQRLFGWTMRA